MKLDDTTKKILITDFEQKLKEYAEKIKLYMKCFDMDLAPDYTIHQEEAMKIERNLIDFVDGLLNEIENEQYDK